jgi:hypothetical protein
LAQLEHDKLSAQVVEVKQMLTSLIKRIRADS